MATAAAAPEQQGKYYEYTKAWAAEINTVQGRTKEKKPFSEAVGPALTAIKNLIEELDTELQKEIEGDPCTKENVLQGRVYIELEEVLQAVSEKLKATVALFQGLAGDPPATVEQREAILRESGNLHAALAGQYAATDATYENLEHIRDNELNDWSRSFQPALDELRCKIDAFKNKIIPGCPGAALWNLEVDPEQFFTAKDHISRFLGGQFGMGADRDILAAGNAFAAYAKVINPTLPILQFFMPGDGGDGAAAGGEEGAAAAAAAAGDPRGE
jgi:hypothetical protein